MVIEGHAEHIKVQALIKQAELAEAGTPLSLDDASHLTTTEVRFPTNPHIAAEKLHGWPVHVDLFHGDTHALSNSIRNAVLEIAPGLHQLYQAAGDPVLGMDLVNRVLFNM